MWHSKWEKDGRGDSVPMTAVDARTLVPVSDEIGGVVIYLGGRPAYYVLNGEWFAAVPEPEYAGASGLSASEIVSTS